MLKNLERTRDYDFGHLSTLRIISSGKLWKNVFKLNKTKRTKILYVTQNIEHVFLPSKKLPKNSYLSIRFISKPADSNEEDFLGAIRKLVLRNPGKIQIAFENLKCKEWFDLQNTGIESWLTAYLALHT